MAYNRPFVWLIFFLTLNTYASSNNPPQVSNATATNICIQNAQNAVASLGASTFNQVQQPDMACTEYIWKICSEGTNSSSPLDLSNCRLEPRNGNQEQHQHQRKRATLLRRRRQFDPHYPPDWYTYHNGQYHLPPGDPFVPVPPFIPAPPIHPPEPPFVVPPGIPIPGKPPPYFPVGPPFGNRRYYGYGRRRYWARPRYYYGKK